MTTASPTRQILPAGTLIRIDGKLYRTRTALTAFCAFGASVQVWMNGRWQVVEVVDDGKKAA